MDTFPIVHMAVPWEYEHKDPVFDVRTLCDGDPWNDGHSVTKYGDTDKLRCQACLEIYSILRSDWNAGSQ